MGSLTSRPKLPPVMPSVIMPAPASPTAPEATQKPLPATDTNAPAAEDDAAGKAPSESRQAAAGLLERKRGRLGTVLTGFRGLLSPTGPAGVKRLLGE